MSFVHRHLLDPSRSLYNVGSAITGLQVIIVKFRLAESFKYIADHSVLDLRQLCNENANTI
jgi:hypothetical protein